MLVSIITSVYNCESYISEMIESILNQTYTDWELIIFDDASTDNTSKNILKYHDSRIKCYRNEENEGLTVNLNKALKKSNGAYIARIDGDDVAYPERLEKQLSFMEQHPDIVLSGAWMKCFGESSGVCKVSPQHDVLKIGMIFNTVMMHPTFIFRRELFTEKKIKYNEKLRYSQDYDFAYRASCIGRISNVSEFLLKYRVHNKQISRKKYQEAKENANITRRKILHDIGIQLTTEAEKVWFRYCENDYHRIFIREKRY